jgi:uncharacterized protein with beta-barrel porin domain
MLPVGDVVSRFNKHLRIVKLLILPLLLSNSGSAFALLTYSPTDIDFTGVDVGTRSDPHSVVLINLDEITITFQDITTEGDFSQTNDCGSLLPPGARCTISVSFTPQSAGSLSGQLVISTDMDPVQVTLSGTALPTVSYVTDLLLSYAGEDPNAISTSETIATTCLSGKISPRMQEDCTAVVSAAAQGISGTGSALLQITPESATKANRTARQGGEAQSRNLSTRINALRAGVRGLSFQGLDLKIYDQNLPIGKLATAYQKQLHHGAGAGADNALLENRFGIFFTGDISTGSKNKTNIESRLDFDTYGITLGADYRFTNQFIFGGAFGYIDTNTTLSNATGNLDTTGYSVSLYGTSYWKKQYFFDFSLSYGSNRFEQHRMVQYELEDMESVSQDMKSDYDGKMFSLFLGSGYDFQYGPWTFGPRTDLEYIRSDVDSFSERASDSNASGGGWSSRIDSTDQKWLTINFGGKLAYAQSTSWGVLVPYTRLDWLHEFKDDAQVINAYFSGDPSGNAIRIETDNPDRDYLRLRMGASAQFRQGVTLFFDYGTLMAHSNWSSNTYNLGLRMKF